MYDILKPVTGMHPQQALETDLDLCVFVGFKFASLADAFIQSALQLK